MGLAVAAVHLSPLTLRSAASVSAQALFVAVTGLIAGWLGVTITLLFLTVSLFMTAGTLAAPFFLICLDSVIAVLAVLGASLARRMAAGVRERNRLRRRIALHRQRLDAIRSHVARLRRAVQTRERVLQARAAELAEAAAAQEKVLAELKRARQLVDAAQRSSRHFVAMMSHEIRTPLHGLMATIDMLREEPLSAQGRHRVSIARASARTLLNIANDILDLSRIDAGVFPLEQRPFQLATVIREVADEARARAESLGLELRTSIEGPLPRSFIGDPARIKQILTNLVSNALKFTSMGSISLQARYDGRQCVIDVSDTGEGVPEDKRDVIFEPFVQAESKVSRRARGAGLGLPISRRLSEAMGGSVVLMKSGPGGSTFRVTLSLTASEEEPVEDQSQRILKNPPGRILVVEDHPASQYVAKSLLESLDCTVTVASTGAEALELLGRESFDLVFMDCQLPGMNGYETTRRMRTVLHRYIPVVAITANAMVDDKQRCLDAGMDDFLPKPFTKSVLSDLLCKWLVPGANAGSENDIAAVIAELPILAAPVFDELWQSLQWRLSPLKKIYDAFLATAHGTLDILHRAPTGTDGVVLARKLHTLLGSAGMVGARQVERIAVWLAEAVRSDRRAELENGRVLLAEAVRRFEQELERRLDSLTR
jgi:signal transduction histidine kinase/ActR/RegA family two-component response regulator/HPt (histidine-containing phosphotransfer) domain-containing protein